ncbi:DUF7389 domain-containing protein [Natrialbaceae archaeon AArc-T1-2]|uniref:DUF7389 domain-containing protein n=1 Tax=Natrialbaceae archaeon AArc-T1-2 TaxID=3053904 RepID=UPI00255B2E61|nr:hypothetical protein [Natrialbaceae archaeon AArc-T1-2]WIV67519.1 hypothetical protein QQ977_01970 [Natrialbaceae archaeon AArc-T1-2]
MSDDSDEISITTELTRGTSTDDRDKIKAEVSAASVDELEHKLERVRRQLEDWAEEVRDIQPENSRGRRRLADDQSELGEVDA